MPRANRHFLPGHVWHLTHRCHKKEFLLTDPIGRFIVKLNEASVATRYPEEIRRLQKDFTQRIVKDILSEGRKALEWTKRQL